MNLEETPSSGQYHIKAYTPGTLRINDQDYHRSVIIAADTLITDWPPQTLNELEAQHFSSILKLKPNILLVGTGEKFSLPPHALFAELYEHQIGVECMDTHAACRTFIALSAESRQVVAALLIK